MAAELHGIEPHSGGDALNDPRDVTAVEPVRRHTIVAALDVEDLVETPEGLRVIIRRSKTDQEGMGRVIGVPYGSTPATCPVRTVRAWREVSAIHSGALFR